MSSISLSGRLTSNPSFQLSVILLACSRLRDSGGKNKEKTRAKKHVGAWESAAFFPTLPHAHYVRVPFLFAPTLPSESLEEARSYRKE